MAGSVYGSVQEAEQDKYVFQSKDDAVQYYDMHRVSSELGGAYAFRAVGAGSCASFFCGLCAYVRFSHVLVIAFTGLYSWIQTLAFAFTSALYLGLFMAYLILTQSI